MKTLCPAVEKIARKAGSEIMQHYAGTKVYIKADGSEVTDADNASEKIILAALQKLTPHIPIVSEERVAAGEVPDVSGGTFWTVDPLDGTKEFIDKTGAFVVAIALIVDNRAVMGIIHHPAMDLLYSGHGLGTASKIDKSGRRTPLIAGKNVSGDMRVLVNISYAYMPGIKGYLSQKFSDKTAIIDGKSGILRACQVADDLADMSFICHLAHNSPQAREGRTAWWDIAPGHAIVESAGGQVETLDGQPLHYGADDLQLPPLVYLSPSRTRALAEKKSPKTPG
ncbi:MAG: 3'(2'),5'-bisphosphate nucleotidase CysQ [Proteobacteria bacterium]|nr:3'(2'),5'-bisphosphate nucleotidase CysQ [Pseudomonadota bacterium]